MSLTCHEEIGRDGRVERGCYGDASDFQTISTCQDGLARYEDVTHEDAARNSSRGIYA